MEHRQLIETLRATLDPTQRQQAEEQLSKIRGVIGFTPTLLQVIMMADVEMPVRQAGAVFLKNLIQFNWAQKEAEPVPQERDPKGRPIKFEGNQMEAELLFSESRTSTLLKTTISEQDRVIIRDAMVDAVVFAPELKAQLSVCVDILVQHDFPQRWTEIVNKISAYLQNPEPSGWTGALLCLYRLVKNQTKNMTAEERAPFYNTMILLHPVINQLIVTLLPDQSEQSVLLQKQILKIYFAITRFRLPLDMISQEVFSHWMEVLCNVVDRPVPDETNLIDESKRPYLPWWKCKKWALRALLNVFKKYGSPVSGDEDYKQFSMWYSHKFSSGTIEVLLRILDQYRRKTYVSPTVIQDILNYIIVGASHTHSMEFLRPHMFFIIRDVLLPIISHSDKDDALWRSDPQDIVRYHFGEGVDQGFVSPVGAARSLLDSVCKKDNNTLQETVQLILQVLSSPDADTKQKVGALHMLALLAEMILIDQMYNDLIESIIQQFILPELRIPHGHSHVSAYRVLQGFSKIKYKEEHALAEAMHLIVNNFLANGEHFVKVEAAFTLQIMLRDQERSHKYVEPQLTSVIVELLSIMEVVDITQVLEVLVSTFTDQIKILAVEMCQLLAQTLGQILSSAYSSQKDTAAKGLVDVVETLLNATEDQPEIHEQLQPLVLVVIDHIFTNSTQEMQQTMFGALNLVYELTSEAISPEMWSAFEQMIQILEKDPDYFTNMMYALHNYITLDTEAFLANPRYVEAIYNTVRAVLTGEDAGKVTEGEAAKLLEVIILQCKGRIDGCIKPFVELALQRLLREERNSELGTMCILVVVSAVYYNPQLLFSIIDTISLTIPQSQSASAIFIKLLLEDTDRFRGLHDRKLSVLGICSLISLNPRPCTVEECATQIIPSLITLFDGLKRQYRIKAKERNDGEDEVLSSDEIGYEYSNDDEMENDSVESIENEDSDHDSDGLHEDFEPLERYVTSLDEENCPIDEFIVFKEVLHGLEGTDKAWYKALTAHLSVEQQKSLHSIMMMADRRKTDAERKKVQSTKATEDKTGYAFILQAPPTSFNFVGIPLGH